MCAGETEPWAAGVRQQGFTPGTRSVKWAGPQLRELRWAVQWLRTKVTPHAAGVLSERGRAQSCSPSTAGVHTLHQTPRSGSTHGNVLTK